jgi:putative ABC transport system permease protein
MVRDLLYSLRLLRRTPGLAVAAVCTFALALGVNIAVFSVVDRVLLQPLPIADANRVVIIWPHEKANATTVGEISHWTFRSWQQRAHSFDTLAAVGSVNWGLVLRESGEPATLPVAAVSASFFPLVRTPAARGRTLQPDDDRRGAGRVVVMAHGSWVRRFGADPNIVGRRLILSGHAYTVVGVMPEGFDYPRGAELWVPVVPQLVDANAQWNVDALESPGFGVLFVLGRLANGITLHEAEAEVSTLIARDTGTAFLPGMEGVVTPLREHVFGKTRPALLAVAVSVGLVLLIACANVAALLLVRAATRTHEIAIRAAMGATRWRILRLSLADALVLSALGGAAALLLARWTIDGTIALAPPDLPGLDAVQLNARTLLFAWIACLASAVFAGLIPGLHASGGNLSDVLKAGSARLTRSHALRRMFVAAQIAMAFALLVAAGLIGRSFMNLVRLDIGFNPSNVLTLNVTLPDASPLRQRAFYTALMGRVRAMRGVDAAGAIVVRPLEHTAIGNDAVILLEGQRVDPASRDWEQNPRTNYEAITSDYFKTMGIRVLRGRPFTDADSDRAPQVAIVSDALAQRLWPGEDPIGKRLIRPDAPRDTQGKPVWSTIVGVVQNVRYRGLTDLRFDLYVPYLQNPTEAVKHLMVRTSLDPISLAPAIRVEARRVEPTALVESVTTMDRMVGRAIAPWRFGASAIGLLSLLALGLAALGVYAIVSQSVVERMHEIAIRTALGAQSRNILRLVFGEGLVMTGAGTIAGLALASGTGRVLASLLFGVRAADPMTLSAIGLLLFIVSVIAMLVPARRALRLDPNIALRQE